MKTATANMFLPIFALLLFVTQCFGQMIDPYLMYGGGMAMYGGLNPYLYNGMAYNPAAANLMYNPYSMDMGMQSAMLANYNTMNSINPMLGANALTGLGNSNVLDSGNTINGFNSVRGFRNRLPTMNRDIGRMPTNSAFGCGMLNSRPCGQRNLGAGTTWENTHDNRR